MRLSPKVKKILKWIAAILLLLFLLVAGIFAYYRPVARRQVGLVNAKVLYFDLQEYAKKHDNRLPETGGFMEEFEMFEPDLPYPRRKHYYYLGDRRPAGDHSRIPLVIEPADVHHGFLRNTVFRRPQLVNVLMSDGTVKVIELPCTARGLEPVVEHLRQAGFSIWIANPN